MAKTATDTRIEELLKDTVEVFWKEDSATRERQLRQYKRLKLLWEGFTQVWYDEVAHDWRIWDGDIDSDSGDQTSYDKPINVFRAYLESIIAALSVLVPPIKCYPDDADNPLDLQTAKASDKIAELIFRHNDGQLLWLQALYTYCTEGMVAAYNYTKDSDEYGTYELPKYEDVEEVEEVEEPATVCTNCGLNVADTQETNQLKDEYDPDNVELNDALQNVDDSNLCPQCMVVLEPTITQKVKVVSRLVGVTTHPKSRQCIEVYGGLYVTVPNYARKQSDIPYLIQAYEAHYASVRAHYANENPELREKIGQNKSPSFETNERMGRQNLQYQGEEPNNMITVRNAWLRPEAFEIHSAEDAKLLKEKYPNGAKVVMLNDLFAEAENENLDDHWTLTFNPMSDYLTFNPIGLFLVSVQEITNDLISLQLQALEHGIPQTFADPNVLDFNGYRQAEILPGSIYPARPKIGSDNLSNAFYEVRTATFPGESLAFGDNIQSLGQMASGAMPSLFGGDIQGSKTASQYSMSRAQSLQRLQNTWKMFTSWHKNIYGKVIPAYIKNLVEDERYVKLDNGNFVNVTIRKAELEGKLGSIELEANENLPLAWNARKDIIMQLMEANNPQILQMLATPENLPLIYEAIGINDFQIPGEDSRNKQYDEIKILLATEPLVMENDPEEIQIGEMMGEPQPAELEFPSVSVEEFDDHQIELAICVKWINSPAGQLAKKENASGYTNVLLHAREHKKAVDEMMAAQMAASGEGAAPVESPNEQDKEAPITGEGDVQTNS